MAKKSEFKIPAIVFIRCIVFLFILWLLFWMYSQLRDFLNNAPIFNVKNVEVEQSIKFIDDRPLKALKGQNILSIDLKRIHEQIANRYPQISQLRIIRQFPDTIMVLAKKRDILFQVQVRKKYLVVDTQGVTMFYSASPLACPLVLGVPLEKKRIVMGTVSTSKELNTVVDLFEQFKIHPHTSRLKVLTVQAENLSKIELMVMPNIQIIIDQEDLPAKVDRLEVLFKNGKVNWSLVKYIDVRFKEPIINETGP